MAYKISDNILSPLGSTTKANYDAVLSGQSAVRCHSGCFGIPEPFAASLFSEDQNRQLAISGLTRFESLVVRSVRSAADGTGINLSGHDVVFILSTTKGNINLLEDSQAQPSDTYPGTAAQHIAHALGITTTPITVCNACISGVSAIILAQRLLSVRKYRYAVVCGADVQGQFIISGFQSLKALSATPCKPFDIERNGLNLGEAASTIILAGDDDPHPTPNAWHITGGAIRNDAFHISSPAKDGMGARLALQEAFRDTEASSLAFINAHGTATMFNDQMESVAISRSSLPMVPINSYKGYFGHTMGAAGILETVLSMYATDNNTIIGTKGFDEIGVSGKILLSNSHSTTDKSTFIKMISGFGGCNAAISVSKSPTRTSTGHPHTFRATHHVSISTSTVEIDGMPLHTEQTGISMLTAIYKQHVGDYPKFYKMDLVSRLGFLAAELLTSAEGDTCHDVGSSRAIVLFNRSSSILSDIKYNESVADADNYYPSPSVFVYTLPNIVTGEIAIRKQYHSETSFFILPERDDDIMRQIVEATFADTSIQSIITGWIDAENDDNFCADMEIVERIQEEASDE